MVGALIAIHWVTFFGAIKYANASVGLVAMATVSLFTAFIEPLYFRRKIRFAEVLLVIPAMLLIVKDLEGQMRLGLGVGLISAFLAALFAVINKKYVEETDPQAITFVELFSAFLVLAVLSPIIYLNYDVNWWPIGVDWFYLLILAVLCTCVAFILHLYALRHISAFASNLAINLEPVYGIILAGVLLGDFEELNYSFYLGLVIILLCVVIYPRFSKRYE
jgi:drug/metabolite transporter (DMT)-like permease